MDAVGWGEPQRERERRDLLSRGDIGGDILPGEDCVLPMKIAVPMPHSNDSRYSNMVLLRFAAALGKLEATLSVVPLASKSSVIRICAECHGVILPGSPADIDAGRYGASRSDSLAPTDDARDDADNILLDHAFHDRKPILGVCHGLQSLNVFTGGSLVQRISMQKINHAISEDHVESHAVAAEPLTALSRVLRAGESDPAEIPVNSNHHQAVLAVGQGLQICARSSDGVIEAIEGIDPNQFVLGVQWHPEGLRVGNRAKDSIFAAFVSAARARKEAER